MSTAAAWRRTQAFSTLQTLWILFLAEEEKADTVPAYEYEDNAAVASADATFLLRIMVAKLTTAALRRAKIVRSRLAR